ncbi:hypothetical protein GCM10008018_36560 [Paenibacillus marchantiophytorum]|uniref:Uncharacterized protein n=1 Tax=Paenibacillus marchantiophytorum TaxID=1619310 RepID=A0ABQ1EUG2_9BACL|nr:hypothetical protein GCM10008018_36560 [Paenibacillus marchantiophytorum]
MNSKEGYDLETGSDHGFHRNVMEEESTKDNENTRNNSRKE